MSSPAPEPEQPEQPGGLVGDCAEQRAVHSVHPIRSFVLRRSHFSTGQRDAYDRLMPVFGIGFSKEVLVFSQVFGRTAPTILEIGFGMGQATAEIAETQPGCDYIGVEVHTPGVGALLKLIEARRLSNLRIIEHDALEVVEYQIPDASLTGIHIFFPDPWPKARHHKRRLIQQQFVTSLTRKLLPGGYLHLATDWPDYAVQMIETVDAQPQLARAIPPRHADLGARGQVTAGAYRPPTKFEQRGMRLGHPIVDVLRVRSGV